MKIVVVKGGTNLVGSLTSPIASPDELHAQWSRLTTGEEDASWDWRDIARECPADGSWMQFELRADGLPQGAMVLKMQHDMRSEASTGQAGCYLEYLATAPWNRPSVIARSSGPLPPKISGVGTLLLAHAIRCSEAAGHDGRLGWHSKPHATDFYNNQLGRPRCGGPDRSVDDLLYFELGTGEGYNLPQGTANRFLDDES